MTAHKVSNGKLQVILGIIIAAIAPTLLSLATFITSISNRSASDAHAAVADKKVETLAQKAEQIHVQGNSNLERLEKRLADANQQIQEMQKQIGTLLTKVSK
jgi:peptidoglycan hydrolase CwlO-like protein